MSLLGHHLKTRRQELLAQQPGYSIRALASRVGIHHSYLSKLERGEHAPLSEERIRALARELGENEDLLLLLGGKVPQRVAQLVGKDPKGFLQSLDNLERKESDSSHSVSPELATQEHETQDLTQRLQDEIRERKELQQQLAVREREKQTILENLTDAIIEFIDSDFTLLWASPGLQEHLGISIDQARGRKCYEAIMGRDSPCPWCLAVTVLETGTVQEKTQEQLGRVWKVRSVPVVNAGGQVETIVNFGFNITSLIDTQKALEESERRWKFALEGAQEGVWDWDVVGNRVFFSRRWKEMLGYEAGEIGDGLEEWNSRIHPDDYDAVMDAVQRHLQGKTPAYECEHRVRCKDGSYKWILDRGMVVQRGQDGVPLRAIGTHFDITAKKEAEERLRNSEAFLQALLMSIQDGISVLKPDLTVSYVNRTMEERFGDLASIVGRKCYEVYRNRNAPCEKCPSIRCLQLGEAQTDVTLLESSDGERWIELHAYPVRSQENGEIQGVVELVRNVTELHQAKLALEASERRYRELFENAPVGICTVSREGAYVTINPAHAAMYGFASPQEMLQKVPSSHSVFAEPADRERMLELLETQDVVTGFECQMRRKDQSLFWTRRTLRALRDPESGRVSHYEAFVEDIQQQKEAELATRQAQQQLLDVLEQLEAGVYVLSPQDGRVIYANQYLCRAMGLELAGRDARTSLLKKPGDCAFLLEEFVSQPGQVHSLELLFANERWYLCTGKVMPWFFGKDSGRTSSRTTGRPSAALAVIVVATDISELKKVEEIKRDIDRVMRHDLKSPLNGIIMLPDLLLSMATRPEDEARMLRAIRDSGKKMLRLIDASLSLYKLETGAYDIMPHDMDMLREVRNAFMEITEQCQRKDLLLELLVAGQPTTQDATVPAVCDATITPYLLSNLLKNAAEAAPVSTAIQVDITPGEPLILSIHNQGAVPEDVRDAFFEKYATSGKKKGTGLGTYSARLIAQAHGGGVRMQTSEATGTTVTVWLPQNQWQAILQRKKES